MKRLLACRVCLAYDSRLCSIMDGQFRDVYEKLVEASLDTDDLLPMSVCYICFSLMKKMLQFRDKSQKANQILQQMISSGLEPSVSSLDMLVKYHTGISWTLGISDVERIITTSYEDEVNVTIESVKSEMDIDGMSGRNDYDNYSDSMPVCRDSISDSEDDLPLQNISEQCKTDRVKIVETPKVLKKISGHEGAAPPENRKLDNNEAKTELVTIQASLKQTKNNEEPIEKEEDKRKIPAFKKGSKKFTSTILKETETTISSIINEQQKDSAFKKNDTVTPPNDIFTCDLCKCEYQCKILLESHIKKSHLIKFNPIDSINSDLNVTNECKSTNLLDVQEIQNNDNRKENVRRKNKYRDNTSQYECQYCMKRFNSNFHLSRHLRVHTKEKPFKCDICEKSFTQSSDLSRHLRVHNREKPFKCDVCDKSFTQSSNLSRHLRVHTKEEPLEICEKDFSVISHLTTQVSFKCDICEKGFSQSAHLIAHLRVHTKEKPFKCDICEKSFSLNSHLNVHLRLHSKEKPFKCQICEKSFRYNSHLNVHLRVHTKEKPFKCGICKKGFSVNSNLTTHLRVHAIEKPFKCYICEKGFTQSSSLTAHLNSRVHTKVKPY